MAKKAGRAARRLSREALASARQRPRESRGTVRATFPGGRVEVNPDDGREYPTGTMLQWADRWTIVGCAWPFDD
jgi:hypothetical protein